MKALTFLMLPLVMTMISSMPMKSYADPQIDILLNIATQARGNLDVTISQISNVPAEINQLYAQGSNETDELAQAATQQDVNSAKQHFLAAMKFFKETNDAINSLNATATNDQQKTEIMQLRGEVIRLENMGNLLKSIALQNNVDINFTSFDSMLQNATQDLNSGNLEDASKQVQNANDFIITTHSSLTQVAQERISQRAKDYTEKQIAQLNATQVNPSLNYTSQTNNTASNPAVPNITQNTAPLRTSNTTSFANNSNMTIESNPKEMITELKQLVAEGKVDQAINLIKIIQAYEKAHSAENSEMSTVNNTQSTPQSTPPTVNNTQSTPQSTPPTVNNTQSTPQSPTNQTSSGDEMKHTYQGKNDNHQKQGKKLHSDD